MANKQYLDYAGLQRLVENIDKKYAPIAALLFKGSVEDIEHLPVLANLKAGWMYNVQVGGGTTSDFVEGPGHIVADGENVAVVELITGYAAVDPAQVTVDKDPKKLGWYELVGTEYVPSEDRIADTTKTYYTATTVKKWDMLGGVFDLEGRYLEFGKEFPESPADERVFLYMGEDTFNYNPVVSPSGRPVDQGWYEESISYNAVTPAGDEDPSAEEWYEDVDVYNLVTPVGDEDPSALGWYEEDGAGGYVLSADGSVQPGKNYYTKSVEKQLTADTSVQSGKTYYEKIVDYVLTTDITVDPLKTYYTKDAEYKTGVIYQYDATATEWVAKSGSAGADMVPITAQEIDELFI